MKRWTRAALALAAAAVVAVAVAWAAGLFAPTDDSPPGVVAQDSVTITVRDPGLLAALTPTTAADWVAVAAGAVLAAAAGVYVRSRLRQRRTHQDNLTPEARSR